MQVFFLVLNKTECLEPLLEKLLECGAHGATVLDSTGMMRVLDQRGNDAPMFGALRHLFDPGRRSSKTLMMVLEDDQAGKVRGIVNEVTGGLDKPDTGVMFAVPVLFAEGMEGCQK
jgi:hypothetical protein